MASNLCNSVLVLTKAQTPVSSFFQRRISSSTSYDLFDRADLWSNSYQASMAIVNFRFPVLFARKTFVAILLLQFISLETNGQQHWHQRDNLDDIIAKTGKVTSDNCAVLERNQLFLPTSTVSHLPDIKQFGIDPIYQNRTNLLQIHNLALNRAFFYSYILQKASDEVEPGLMYYMLSTVADVSSNPSINASAIYYSPNRAFTPSYNGFFNKTMPLFAPRAHRVDDYNDPYQLKGVSTMNTIVVSDLGAIRPEMRDSNYTTDVYKINEWYTNWLPDLTKRHDSKPTYSVLVSHSNGTNETFTFHGPPGASDEPGPVKWQRPYFDCNRSNKWILGASVPIADLYPRHTGWRHIELPTYVAASVVEMDFYRLDINQCPQSEGNNDPNYFAGTAKCKKDTTTCEPVHGYGFRRGGYKCRCRPGYRLPKHMKGPYWGELIERASESEYKDSFNCHKIDNLAVKTQNVQPLEEKDRNKIMSRMETLTGLYRNSSLAGSRYDINQISEKIRKAIGRDECQLYMNIDPSRLRLPGNFAYGKEQQFENQARAALRVSHFISSFLQVVDPREAFAEFRVPDKPLSKDQVIGEALSTLISDRQIQGIGIWFDRNQFNQHKSTRFFAPYAYRLERNARNFFVLDMAAKSPDTEEHYTSNESFQSLKTRWMIGTENLDTYTVKVNIRFNSSGLNLIRYDQYPLQYKVAQLEHGYWSEPFQDCGLHNQWLISYSSPFFGWDHLKMRVEFKGIVIVNLKLSELDVNQCDADDYHVSNAFKDTHKCDRKSTKCVPVPGRKFESGGYKCECLQGYEYPFNTPTTYIDGQMMEAEYSNVVQGRPSRFDSLVCRLAFN